MQCDSREARREATRAGSHKIPANENEECVDIIRSVCTQRVKSDLTASGVTPAAFCRASEGALTSIFVSGSPATCIVS